MSETGQTREEGDAAPEDLEQTTYGTRPVQWIVEGFREIAGANRQEMERIAARAITEHEEAEHFSGTIRGLVDAAVAERFQQYARFLIDTDTARQIDQVAAQLDDAIDQELEDLGTGETESEAAG